MQKLSELFQNVPEGPVRFIISVGILQILNRKAKVLLKHLLTTHDSAAKYFKDNLLCFRLMFFTFIVYYSWIAILIYHCSMFKRWLYAKFYWGWFFSLQDRQLPRLTRGETHRWFWGTFIVISLKNSSFLFCPMFVRFLETGNMNRRISPVTG